MEPSRSAGAGLLVMELIKQVAGVRRDSEQGEIEPCFGYAFLALKQLLYQPCATRRLDPFNSHARRTLGTGVSGCQTLLDTFFADSPSGRPPPAPSGSGHNMASKAVVISEARVHNSGYRGPTCR